VTRHASEADRGPTAEVTGFCATLGVEYALVREAAMSVLGDIWSRERNVERDGPRFFRNHLAADTTMVFLAPAGTLKGEQTREDRDRAEVESRRDGPENIDQKTSTRKHR
jgi:hypothetical protein